MKSTLRDYFGWVEDLKRVKVKGKTVDEGIINLSKEDKKNITCTLDREMRHILGRVILINRGKKLMFSKQLEIPICEKHFEEHKEVMILNGNGYDIEEIVEMTPEDRKRLSYTIVLSGMDLSNIEV